MDIESKKSQNDLGNRYEYSGEDMMNRQVLPNRTRQYKDDDDISVAERFVWATNEGSRRQGINSYLIQSIAQRHGGDAHIDFFRHSIDINVPDEKKLACTREIEKKVGLTLH